MGSPMLMSLSSWMLLRRACCSGEGPIRGISSSRGEAEVARDSPSGGGGGEGKKVGLQLAKLETMKIGNVLEVEESSIFGRKRGLLCFIGDRNQSVATIRMVGSCTRVHTEGIGECYATYKGITSERGSRRFGAHENIIIRLDLWN